MQRWSRRRLSRYALRGVAAAVLAIAVAIAWFGINRKESRPVTVGSARPLLPMMPRPIQQDNVTAFLSVLNTMERSTSAPRLVGNEEAFAELSLAPVASDIPLPRAKPSRLVDQVRKKKK